MESLKIEKFKRQLPEFLLEADFTVNPGERLTLTGQSGCGKSTLMRWISGVEVCPNGSGKIKLGSDDLTHASPQCREFGVVFQEAVLFSELTVLENAAFGLRMRGVMRKIRRDQVMPWLEKWGLCAHAERRVDTLSGGEKQRLALIRAVVWKPRALLLDEPFSALDRKYREGLRQDLLSLHAEWPVPLIFVTHDREDVKSLSTRELVCESVDGGRRHVWRDA